MATSSKRSHDETHPHPRRSCCRRRSLEEWGDIEVFHFLPPWHSKAYVDKLRAISAVTRCAFYAQPRIDEHGSAFRGVYKAMNGLARYRWRHRAFGFPVELELANFALRRVRGFL